jgi:hypothetical protein
MWKRSYGRATKAPPDERGGNRHARPTATAPYPDSTRLLALICRRKRMPPQVDGAPVAVVREARSLFDAVRTPFRVNLGIRLTQFNVV